MDRDRLLEHLLHYPAMFLAVWIVMDALWRLDGRQALWLELLVLVAVCLAYIAAVRRVGIAPSSWS